MPDARIPSLPFDTSNEDIQRNDLVLVSRNGSGVKARIDGSLVLPAFSATDAGKILEVQSTGKLGLADRAVGASSWALRATASPTDQQVNVVYAQTLGGGFSIASYTDLICNLTAGNGTITTARVAPMLNIVQVTDGWRIWWSANNALSWARPAGSQAAGTLHVYGRVG